MLAENDEMRRNVLERLSNEMDQLGIKSRMIYKGEEGSRFDILACAHDALPGMPEGAVGQYYFPVAPAAENVFYFTAMVTIKEGVSEEEAAKMKKEIDEINLELLCGQFAVYPEIGLIYKLSYPITEGIDEDELFAMIDIASAHCVLFVSNYASRILG